MTPLSRRPVAALAAAVALLATTACTGGSEPAADDPPSASPTESASPAARSVPFKVRVTRVLGTLRTADRPPLEANVRRTIAEYVDAAFLGGDYPRSDFAGAFRAFTPGAARDARRDLSMLTNAPLGSTTESVTATRRTAYLSVLAPNDVAAGVTAKVDLVFRVERGDRPAQRVHVAGRLLLTRDKGAGWSIFGYDLHRSGAPAPARSGS